MNAVAHPFAPSALSLPKQRKNPLAPRGTKGADMGAANDE